MRQHPGAAKTGCDQRSGVVHARVATEVAELAWALLIFMGPICIYIYISIVSYMHWSSFIIGHPRFFIHSALHLPPWQVRQTMDAAKLAKARIKLCNPGAETQATSLNSSPLYDISSKDDWKLYWFSRKRINCAADCWISYNEFHLKGQGWTPDHGICFPGHGPGCIRPSWRWRDRSATIGSRRPFQSEGAGRKQSEWYMVQNAWSQNK